LQSALGLAAGGVGRGGGVVIGYVVALGRVVLILGGDDDEAGSGLLHVEALLGGLALQGVELLLALFGHFLVEGLDGAAVGLAL